GRNRRRSHNNRRLKRSSPARGGGPSLISCLCSHGKHTSESVRCGAVRGPLVQPAVPDLPPRDVFVLGRKLDRPGHPFTLSEEIGGASHACPRAHEDLPAALPIGGSAGAAVLALFRS
ncbi:unnamed protein product, partial [Laminaria digitata]